VSVPWGCAPGWYGAPLALTEWGVRSALACGLAIAMPEWSGMYRTGNSRTGNWERERGGSWGTDCAGPRGAVVNKDLILESDLDEETRMAAFQPFSDQAAVTRDELIERLIDRDLILQQIRMQPRHRSRTPGGCGAACTAQEHSRVCIVRLRDGHGLGESLSRRRVLL